MSDVFWRCIPNLNPKSYQLLCHKFADFWQIERDRKAWQTDGGTDGRTNIDFFGPPYTKSPFGAIIEQLSAKHEHLLAKQNPWIYVDRIGRMMWEIYSTLARKWDPISVPCVSFQKLQNPFSKRPIFRQTSLCKFSKLQNPFSSPKLQTPVLKGYKTFSQVGQSPNFFSVVQTAHFLKDPFL